MTETTYVHMQLAQQILDLYGKVSKRMEGESCWYGWRNVVEIKKRAYQSGSLLLREEARKKYTTVIPLPTKRLRLMNVTHSLDGESKALEMKSGGITVLKIEMDPYYHRLETKMDPNLIKVYLPGDWESELEGLHHELSLRTSRESGARQNSTRHSGLTATA